MTAGRLKFRQAVVLTYILLLHLVAGYYLFKEARSIFDGPVSTNKVEVPIAASPVPTPIAVPSVVDDLSTPESSETKELVLTIPVAGVSVEQLVDSYTEVRGEGRSHDAIDITAPEGTAVLAAADGEIARFFDSVPGGITIYQLTTDRRHMLYYAHLQKRAEGLKPGDEVKKGQSLGYVGDTGNAGEGNFHLHFSVAIVKDPARYWEGEYINPFPLFRESSVK